MTTHPATLEPDRLWRSTLAPAVVGIMSLVATTPLFAQRPAQPSWVFEGFAARKQPEGSLLFGGIALTRYAHVIGLRAAGAVHPRTEATGGPTDGLGVWTAHADLIVEPLRVAPRLRMLLLGFSPYAFGGVGGVGVAVSGDKDTNVAVLSYGLGVHHDMIGPLGIQAEARYRSALESGKAFPGGVRENLEYSLGFRLSFGGHSGSKTAKKSRAPARTVAPQSAARFASGVLDVAESYLNTPYWYGGAGPYGGFDAGGFVQYVFGRSRVRLPRASHEIAKMCEGVSLQIGSLRPADLLFFASDRSNIDHVAIYAGHERIIHSSASGGGVRYDILSEGERGRWFADHLVSACRIVGDGLRPADETDPDKTLDPPDLAPPVARAP